MIRFYAMPMSKPEDVRPCLGDPERHWRKGYSALELATSWMHARGFPLSVRAVLDQDPLWRSATMLDGFFERQVDLKTRGFPSQADLVVLSRLDSGLGVIAVEGKVREPFGKIVRDWNTSNGREERLASLCRAIGADRTKVNSLRYQLFHRAASALFEAERYGAQHALMLVHSFSEAGDSLSDFQAFCRVVGFGEVGKGQISAPRRCGDVDMQLGWVSDKPTP